MRTIRFDAPLVEFRTMAQIGRVGGLNRAAVLSAKQRTLQASGAAKARWDRPNTVSPERRVEIARLGGLAKAAKRD